MVNAEDHNGHDERSPEIGALLERKRREKGLSLKDVEHATKIRSRYLEGLEREDYESLPDAVYVRGFLKTYANFLGLDGERLSRELRDRRAPRRERQLGHQAAPPATEFEEPLIPPGDLDDAERGWISRRTILPIALAVLVLTAGALYFIGSRSNTGPADEPQQNTPVEYTPAESESAPASPQVSPENTATQALTNPVQQTTTPQAPANTVRVTLRVTGSPSWLSIQTDGTNVYNQVAQPGFSQTFEGRNVTLTTGNAGAVQVEVDGRDMGYLGGYGQSATRTYTSQTGG